MNEPSSYSEIAEPQIDPSQWEDELPAFLRAVADRPAREAAEAGQSMSAYFQGAQTPSEIQGPIDEAVAGLAHVQELFAQAASAAESYVAGLQLPHFEKVS